MRTCLLYSIGSSVGIGIPFGILFALKSDGGGVGKIMRQTFTTMAIIFVISLLAFVVIGTMARHREKTLAERDFDDEDDSDEI